MLSIIVCLFLVPSQIASTQDIGTYLRSVNQKVSSIETKKTDIFIRDFNILSFALGLYNLDAKERLTKVEIKERLAKEPALLRDKFGVSFDMDKIDFKKKGFTRYYPFSVSGKDFIIRIFDINEKHYLAECQVVYEGAFEKSSLGFQIIPGIKTILDEKKTEKVVLVNPAACSTQI